MQALILGLVLFLGIHSVRIVAEDWRTARRAAMGEAAWKGVYSLISAVGFGLIIWGYGQARQAPVVLWDTPNWTRHFAALLTMLTFVFIAAAYVPGNAIKARLQHPMILGVKVWALTHLLANNTLADLLLFGSFLVWSVFNFRAARRREPVTTTGVPSAAATALTIAIGVAVWAAFAFWGHAALIGIRPFVSVAPVAPV